MSNNFRFTGRLAEAPELTHGKTAVCRFRLIRNEYAGKDDDDQAKERLVAIRFTIFGKRAEWLAKNTRKGDQLIVEARVQNEDWTDQEGKEHYSYGFIVTDVEQGAPGAATRRAIEDRMIEKAASERATVD